MSPSPKDRYAARVDELDALVGQLNDSARPGGRAPVVGQLLEALGDLLRRRGQVPCAQPKLDTALSALDAASLEAWVSGLDAPAMVERLKRAATHAVESALPEFDDDGPVWASWALQGLLSRDRLESAVTVLEVLVTRGTPGVEAVATRLRTQTQGIDDACRSTALALTALNGARKSEVDLLDENHRARAWWFSSFVQADTDGLVQALAGDGAGLPERYADAHRLVTKPRRSEPGFDELLAFDLGLASQAQSQALRARAKVDPEFKLVMAALRAGDEAIEALEAPAADIAPVPAAATGRAPEVLLERADFKVLLLRPGRRLELVVQANRAERLEAAAVFVSTAPQKAVPSAPGALGLHFQLDDASRLEGRSARISVRLVGGRTVEAEVSL